MLAVEELETTVPLVCGPLFVRFVYAGVLAELVFFESIVEELVVAYKNGAEANCVCNLRDLEMILVDRKPSEE